MIDIVEEPGHCLTHTNLTHTQTPTIYDKIVHCKQNHSSNIFETVSYQCRDKNNKIKHFSKQINESKHKYYYIQINLKIL